MDITLVKKPISYLVAKIMLSLAVVLYVGGYITTYVMNAEVLAKPEFWPTEFIVALINVVVFAICGILLVLFLFLRNKLLFMVSLLAMGITQLAYNAYESIIVQDLFSLYFLDNVTQIFSFGMLMLTFALFVALAVHQFLSDTVKTKTLYILGVAIMLVAALSLYLILWDEFFTERMMDLNFQEHSVFFIKLFTGYAVSVILPAAISVVSFVGGHILWKDIPEPAKAVAESTGEKEQTVSETEEVPAQA